MNPCKKCQQIGDKNHNCSMPESFRLECGAVEKSPQNLAKPDAYSLLAEVRAVEKALEIMDELIRYHEHYCDTEMYQEKTIREKAVEAIQKISEHLS